MNKQSSRTQIVATLGPSSASPEIIEEMIKHCMDVVRLNFSWGDHDGHKKYIETIRNIGERLGIRIPIIADLSGPRVSEYDGGHHFGGDGSSIITDKDKKDLEFVVGLKVEYVAMSYVGNAEDIKKLRKLIQKIDGNSKTKIIAKIERDEAVKNINEIVKESDAIMVARGDLGNEVPIEQIPFVEKDLIDIANKESKPVIVATEMMPSMIESEKPTRSDVTDVAYAVVNDADAVMLSNETAIGKNPIEVVKVMETIVLEAEKHNSDKVVNLL